MEMEDDSRNKNSESNFGPHAHPLIGETLIDEPLIGEITKKQGKKKKPSFIKFHS